LIIYLDSVENPSQLDALDFVVPADNAAVAGEAAETKLGEDEAQVGDDEAADAQNVNASWSSDGIRLRHISCYVLDDEGDEQNDDGADSANDEAEVVLTFEAIDTAMKDNAEDAMNLFKAGIGLIADEITGANFEDKIASSDLERNITSFSDRAVAMGETEIEMLQEDLSKLQARAQEFKETVTPAAQAAALKAKKEAAKGWAQLKSGFTALLAEER